MLYQVSWSIVQELPKNPQSTKMKSANAPKEELNSIERVNFVDDDEIWHISDYNEEINNAPMQWLVLNVKFWTKGYKKCKPWFKNKKWKLGFKSQFHIGWHKVEGMMIQCITNTVRFRQLDDT